MASNSRKKKPAARNPQGPSGKPQAGKAAGSGSTPAGTTPAGNTPAGNTTAPKTKGRQPPSPQARTAVGSGPSKSAIKRQSVASARKKSGVDKTQLYILGAAVVVIIAVIVFGFVLNNQNTAAQNDGYGSAKSTVATVQDGVITVSNNTTPPADAKTIDLFEDPLCPFCGAFERQYGQQIAQALDDGKLVVNYHLVNFLDGKAASPDYSTRASGALICVAQSLGSEPGVYSRFHEQLYSEDVQPTEGGDTDLTNEQFVEQLTAARTAMGQPAASSGTDSASGSATETASATQSAASGSATAEDGFAAASACILNGSNAALVETQTQTSVETLTAATGKASTPTVLYNGAPVGTDDVNWLTNILAGT